MNLKISDPSDKKRAIWLGGLLVVLVAIYFYNSSPDIPQQSLERQQRAAARPTPGPPVPNIERATTPVAANRSSRQRNLQEFRPSLKPKKPEERADPMSVDPTLRTDILAKLQKVEVTGTHRSIFDFTAQPAATPTLVASAGKVPNPVLDKKGFVGPIYVAPPPPPGPTPPPPPTPIPFKFYGYVNASTQGQKTAFFLEGDDIHVVREGDTVKRRYRIVRIGVNSVVVEDTNTKSQQTLPLEEQPG